MAAPLYLRDGIPVYKSGTAPEGLHTREQLREPPRRLRPAPGQRPACLILTKYWGEEIKLYNPADAEPLPPLDLGTAWAMRTRRTCPKCGRVGKRIVRHGTCGPCLAEAEAARKAKAARTCSRCRRVGSKPLPLAAGFGWHAERLCRRCTAAKNRKKDELLRAAIRCPGGCGRRTATRKQVLDWAMATRSAIPRWQRWCPPCDLARQAEQQQREAERQAARERQRAEEAAREQERRTARRTEVAALSASAATALTNPNLAVLDTETTGLDDDARIVEISATAADGTILLDTLLNPGGPIPPSATRIHGITDAMVAGAPTFAQALPAIEAAITGKRVLIYNANYNTSRLQHELEIHLSGVIPGQRALDYDAEVAPAARWMTRAEWEDAMEPYSDWVGEEDDWHSGYRRQRLNGGHRALGDCLAVIECLKAMAKTKRES